MKAIILAAGYSVRLYPLTENFPKGLLPVKNKPILAHALDQIIKSSSIEDVAIITNNRFFKIFQDWLNANFQTNRIKLLNDKTDSPENRLGALGDLLYVINNLKWQDDLLVISSDTLTSMKIEDFIHFFQKKQAFINAVIDVGNKNIIKNKLGSVVLKKDRIIDFIEKPTDPPTTITSIPFYIFPKASIALIKTYKTEGHDMDAPGSIIPWLLNKIPCYGFRVKNGYYYDVGTLDIYNQLKNQAVH